MAVISNARFWCFINMCLIEIDLLMNERKFCLLKKIVLLTLEKKPCENNFCKGIIHLTISISLL